MVKKIRLDFSKTEERSGWNTRHMPEGVHKFKVEAVEQTEAQDGTDMLVYALVPADPRYKTRRFPFYCKLQPNQLWKLRDLLVATGSTVPKKAGQIDIEAPVGKYLAAEVVDGTGQYSERSEVQGTYSTDILDDEDGDSGAEDDEDEEYEGDEEEADEEEDEPALEDLSLAELRKLAKPLGIEGYLKLKKDELIEAIEEEGADDEDEDDLDDEDLDDEELEDEEEFDDEEDEEEEEPVKPARRSAPAKKAPARPAAKPAARRVQRR